MIWKIFSYPNHSMILWSSGDEILTQPTCPHFAAERDVTMWVSCYVNAGEVQRKVSERKTPACGGVDNFSQTRINPHSPKQKYEIILLLFIYSFTPESHENFGFTLKNFLLSFFVQCLHILMLLKIVVFFQLFLSRLMNHYSILINMHFD